MISQARNWVQRHTGWRGLLFDFSLGGVASLSLLPAGILPAALCFILIFWRLLDVTSKKAAFLRAWMAATGWFSISLYWISHSLFVGDAAFLFMLPFSALGLPLFLGIFWGSGAYFARLIAGSEAAYAVMLALCLGVAELARGTLLTGFPWNAPAHIVLAAGPFAQSGAFIGQYGINFAFFGLIAALVILPRKRQLAILLCLPVILLCVLSLWRAVSMPPLEVLTDGRPVVRLVQPNIPQADKWDRQKRPLHLVELQDLSRLTYPLPQLVIWPETAIAGVLPKETDLLRESARNAAAFDGMLLTGMLRFDERDRLYNSAVLASGDGTVLAITDKLHLVPFGEYVPIRQIPFIDAIAGAIDFTAGQQPQIFDVGSLGQLEVLICYEVIFPGFLHSRPRPAIIVNLTNDAWFGHTAGPYQHLHQARARAIEDGLPILRVANTGITAGIDPYGRVIKSLKLGESGMIDVAVPKALAPTVFAQYPWAGTIFMALWLLGFWIWLDQRVQKRQINKVSPTNMEL